MKNEIYRTMFPEYADALDVKDVQQILGVGRKSVYKLIEAHAFHAVRVGKGFKIAKVSLIDFLVGGNTPAA